jgi:hypothetical protein
MHAVRMKKYKCIHWQHRYSSLFAHFFDASGLTHQLCSIPQMTPVSNIVWNFELNSDCISCFIYWKNNKAKWNQWSPTNQSSRRKAMTFKRYSVKNTAAPIFYISHKKLLLKTDSLHCTWSILAFHIYVEKKNVETFFKKFLSDFHT